jgi:hypothetical protein
MKYNLLPSAIVARYAIQYSELVQEAITIFKNSDDKWGVLKETAAGEFTLLAEPVYNTIRIDKSGRYLVLKDDCMGLLDSHGETIIAPAYVSLSHLQSELYKAQQGDGYGIIDVSENILLDLKYRYIFTHAKNDRVIVQDLSDRYFTFHFPTRELHALPYDSIFLATGKTYSGGQAEPGLCKVIRQCQETEFDYYDNGMSAFTGIWGIIHADGTVKIPCEYAFVDVFEDPHFFRVAKGNFNFYFDDDGVLIAEGVKWGVVDGDNNIIVPIEYDWVQEAGETHWVVNKGGTVFFDADYEEERWTVRGGQFEDYKL